jgi:hypothetical protein
MKSPILNIAFFLSAILAAASAMAYDGQVTGQIDIIQGASASANAPFGVSLKNAPALCGNTNTSAYLLNTDGNYRVNAAILLTAKSLGSTVVLSSNRDSNGNCQIQQFTIQ